MASAITSRGPVTECWCATKHLLHAEGHLEEMIANASRARDQEEVQRLALELDQVRAIRQRIMNHAVQKEMALAASLPYDQRPILYRGTAPTTPAMVARWHLTAGGSQPGCSRCEADRAAPALRGIGCPRCGGRLKLKRSEGLAGVMGACPICAAAFLLGDR